MDRRKFLVGLLTCPACAAAAQAESAHWSYEGHGAPAEWGELDSTYKACAVGAEQSPIDLAGAKSARLAPLGVDWKPESFKIENNGHTIQATSAGGGGLTLDGEKYALKQFHFHTPSEHALDGKFFDLEAHFVHANAKGGLAVVGVFMSGGGKHDGLSSIMAAAPKIAGEAATLKAPLDPKRFLPKSRERFRYEGSLTTPPCSEVVDWNVFSTAISVAKADVDAFKALFPMNARPVQETHRRFLLKG
jgi:carbonic anhydrase